MRFSQRKQQLVYDALYEKRMKYIGCFEFNKASEKVRDSGGPTLPLLEQVIRNEVMPHYSSDPQAQHKTFPGLGNLLVDYFQIAKDGHLDRAVEFFPSLRGPVLSEAMRMVGGVWERELPQPLLKIVRSISRTGTPEERGTARWLLRRQRTSKKVARSAI